MFFMNSTLLPALAAVLLQNFNVQHFDLKFLLYLVIVVYGTSLYELFYMYINESKNYILRLGVCTIPLFIYNTLFLYIYRHVHYYKIK